MTDSSGKNTYPNFLVRANSVSEAEQMAERHAMSTCAIGRVSSISLAIYSLDTDIENAQGILNVKESHLREIKY